jgi:hypothetical protein
VNLGGEPERDDFGLPPVDIEIPDDARELDRDVQAYRREQRALRRNLRRRRLHTPLTGDGMVMPLLAGCLVFALIAAVLLTVFAATGDVVPKGAAQKGAARTAAPATMAPSGTTTTGTTPSGPAFLQLKGHLPDKTIEVRGEKVPLPTLTPSALAVVPLTCACTKALQQLITQAAQYRVALYLVTTGAGAAGLQALAASRSAVRVAVDQQDVLASTYPVFGLSVILVHADGSLALARGLQPGLQLRGKFQGLRSGGGPAASPGT